MIRGVERDYISEKLSRPGVYSSGRLFYATNATDAAYPNLKLDKISQIGIYGCAGGPVALLYGLS